LGLAVVWLLIKDDALGAVVIAVFLGLSFTYFLRDDRCPTVFDLLFTLAALLVAFGDVFGLFERVVLYDKLTHVFMAFAVSLAFFFLFYRDASPRWPAIAMATSVFTLGVSAGALWEIFEWSTGNEYTYADTITDLLMDSAGALGAALLALAIHQRGGRIT
jgi:hypothetical protein